MGVMTLLVICSIVVSSGFLLAFLWATRRGQYDDMATPSIRMLFEDRHTDESETEHDVRHSSDRTKQ
jgi:cbb3-type cytochrome oxidase maturation protein